MKEVSEFTDTLNSYYKSLDLAALWLIESINKGNGGSCGYFSPLGWSKPYPETTGYIIPTLLRLSDFISEDIYKKKSVGCGSWLISIQNEDGSWNGGFHPDNKSKPSIFNSGQILKGMVTLFNETQNEQYLEAANKCGSFLLTKMDDNGMFVGNDYRSKFTPSYYTSVAWPMLELWALTNNNELLEKTVRFLDLILNRKRSNGSFDKWGFEDNGLAYTHTIAYTIRGFQEASRILGDKKYSDAMLESLNFFIKESELNNGKLPGMYDENLKPHNNFVCLTGNSQLAISIMILNEKEKDLRLVNSALKLIDHVCLKQSRSIVNGVNGGIFGSSPIYGKYMTLRIPNWSAKYHIDSLIMLLKYFKVEKI